MLVVKVYVNSLQIDEIHIHNKGPILDGIYSYGIDKPEGFEDKRFWHRRSDGYGPLLIEVLNYLEQEGRKSGDEKGGKED